MIRPLIFALCLLCATPTLAFEAVEHDTETFTQTYILSNIPDFVKTPKGGTDWQLFGATNAVEFHEKDAEGFDLSGVKPNFTPALKALHNQTITLQGYMFPLDPTQKQARFLFGPFPASCPFHYHVGPNLMIEVLAKSPIPFSYDAFNLEGRLELIDLDIENNIFYRLHDAKLVK